MLWLIGVIALLAAVQLYRQNVRHKGQPPVLRTWIPFVGCAVKFGLNPAGFVVESRKKLGPVFTATMLGKRLTFVASADNHEVFFKTPNEYFSPREVYRVMKPIFGPGVVYDAVSYERMREQLNFVAVELNTKNFRAFVPVISEETADRVSRWGPSGELNILTELSQLIVQTASHCLLGRRFRDEVNAEDFARYLYELETGLNPLGVFYPWLPSPKMNVTHAARREIATVLRNILRKRKESKETETDVLQSLIEGCYRDGTPVSEDDMVGILIGALFAGQHTSAIVSSWTALFLAAHPEIVEQLRAERAGAPMTIEYINEAPLLEACVKESLRLNPPLVMLMRHVRKTHAVAEHEVRAGDIIVMSPLGSMRDDSIFSNPAEWDPQRFLPPREEQNKRTMAFVGFGAGSHRCLGEKFGLLQVKTVIATLIEHYDLQLVGNKGQVPEPDYRSMVVGPLKSQSRVKYSRRSN
eukprot:TRINITY_DN309_c0_g1_i1.p1 TRINITY_DN309_c0_g1~~TRINITY_DN309_c0_g1_i1.p1  ORF type:complete len:469 (+),score=101.44 TRINITY_DN309_c0_g1_i1:174-1580(+)